MNNIFKSKNYRTSEMVGFMAFFGVILVQRFIRPYSQHYDETSKYLLGIMPNLLAGIAMSIALFIHGKSYYDKWHWSPVKALWVSVLISILGLTLWEYIQTFTHHRFDMDDVIATVIGSLFSLVFVYANIVFNKRNNSVE